MAESDPLIDWIKRRQCCSFIRLNKVKGFPLKPNIIVRLLVSRPTWKVSCGCHWLFDCFVPRFVCVCLCVCPVLPVSSLSNLRRNGIVAAGNLGRGLDRRGIGLDEAMIIVHSGILSSRLYYYFCPLAFIVSLPSALWKEGGGQEEAKRKTLVVESLWLCTLRFPPLHIGTGAS